MRDEEQRIVKTVQSQINSFNTTFLRMKVFFAHS